MASPPRTANSPPYPMNASLPNPKKRGPSLQLGIGGPPKRRKHGAAGSMSGSTTSSAHPLRQTSFPPEESAIDEGDTALRSPSVESDFTGMQSAVTGGTGPGTGTGTGKKRGKGKAKKGRQRDGTSRSAKSGGPRGGAKRRTSGGAAGERGRRATSHPGGGAGGGHDDDDEADDDDDDDDDTGAQLDDPDQKADREKLGVLIDALDRDQFERYEMFRRVKFKKETVRRITNYIVSQSVPPAVILTINGFAKTFVGLLIERARAVQGEEARAGVGVSSVAGGGGGVNGRIGGRLNGSGNQGRDPGVVDPARLVVGDGVNGIDGGGKEVQKDLDLGPLMPDHLREALRRYKRDGEGGGTGLTGVSVGLGVQGSGAARLQGKRLFM